MSSPKWWGDWRPNLTPHTGNLQPTDLIECTMMSGGVPTNTVITGAQIIAASGGGGGATWGGITGTLSAQTDLQGALDNKVPYTGATADVNLGSHDLTATQGTFATGGSSDTLTVNHTSGSGKAITITKGGAGEGIYVNKTSGSGNAVTIVGDLEATTIKKTSGTSTQFLKADGSVDTTTYQPTLVSGTNIKTVNGNSLVGSGDVTTNPRTLASVNGSNVSGLVNLQSASIFIPAGTISTNNTIYIKAFIERTVVSGAGATVFRFYVNTSNSITGATYLGSGAAMATTVRFQRFERNIFFDGTKLNVYNIGISSSTDYTSSAISLIGFNPAVDNYLLFAVQHSTSLTDVANWRRVITQAYD
jgi:hypothetical protein